MTDSQSEFSFSSEGSEENSQTEESKFPQSKRTKKRNFEDKLLILSTMRFCDALWGAVVGRKPEFEVTSQILWVTSSRISFWEVRIRSPQDIILFGVFDLGETEFAPPRTKFEMTSLRGFVKSPRILVYVQLLHPKVHHRTASSTISSAYPQNFFS